MSTASPIASLTAARGAAYGRIRAIDPAAYASTRNHLQGAVTGLSPWITHGVVSLREVLTAVLEQHDLPVQHRLVQELGWREFFRHVWEHRGDGILDDLHPGPMPRSAYASKLPPDLAAARTGVPVIDRAVRQLLETGMLHNHARLWLASYTVHLRHVHWRAGADWMLGHLIDGDVASNHLSWQWVAGTGSHQPYLFNADNVARFAPVEWHSPGTVVDATYDDLQAVARGGKRIAVHEGARDAGIALEHVLHGRPPLTLGSGCAERAPIADAEVVTQALRGRCVWLVHPWALRPPPADQAEKPGHVVLGVYPDEVLARWPWSERRWQWVDDAMAELTPMRCHMTAGELAHLCTQVHQVDTYADLHLRGWLDERVNARNADAVFRPQQALRSSFSGWWRHASAGIRQARELLQTQ